MSKSLTFCSAAICSLVVLSGCGSPKTTAGTPYKAISASDVETACRKIEAVDLMPVNAIQSVPKRDQERILNSCCSAAKASAADLDGVQRAYLYNHWMAWDTVTQTANEVQVYRDLQTALGKDLTTAQRIAASGIRPTASRCVSEGVAAARSN